MAEVTPGAVAPAVPAADAAPEILSTAEEITEVPEGTEPEAKPERTFTQKEVDEIAAKRAARAERSALKIARAEAERDLYRQQLEEARRPADQPQQQGKPQAKDYPDWESLNEATIRWEVDQRIKAMRDETAAEQQRSNAQRQEQELARTIRDSFKTAAEKYADFNEVVTADGLPFHEGSPMIAFFSKSKVGGEVAYHLGNNPAEAQRIASLHPLDQVRELLSIEAKLSAPPKPTNAPPPIVPNKGSSNVVRSLSDLIGGSQEEFEKRRNERIKATRRK